MQPELKKAALLLGLGIFAICFAGMMLEADGLVIIISHFLPGFLYSLLLIHYSEFSETASNKFFFIVLSSVAFILCVAFVDLGSGARMASAIKLIIASAAGAVMLKTCYDHFYAHQVTGRSSFVLPAFTGAIASIPSAICVYFYRSPGFEETWMQMLLYAGIFSLFPVWLYFMSVLIVRTDHGE